MRIKIYIVILNHELETEESTIDPPLIIHQIERENHIAEMENKCY